MPETKLSKEKRIVTEITREYQRFTPTRPIRVCVYVRVSTSHEGQHNSLNNQTAFYENRFSQNKQFQFIGIFIDAGISGTKENRPGFQSMLAKARAGEIDVIYTKSISRFARNTLLLLQAVRELRAIDVAIIFEEQNINTLYAEGELMLTVLAGIAEAEQKSTRTNIQWTMQKKFLRGKVMVNTNLLLGYDKDESGNLVINHEQAKVVRKIFQMYLGKNSAYKIAQILNMQQVPTYLDKNWQASRILSIISNEKYIGACLMQKSYVDESGRQVKNSGQRDRYWVDDDHPAIITRADYDQAQLIRQSRARKTYPFTSLLHCYYCGSVMIRVVHKRRWVSWICSKYLQKGKAACAGTRIAEPRLIELSNRKPIDTPVVVKEVHHGQKSRTQRKKNYSFTPVSNNAHKKPKI